MGFAREPPRRLRHSTPSPSLSRSLRPALPAWAGHQCPEGGGWSWWDGGVIVPLPGTTRRRHTGASLFHQPLPPTSHYPSLIPAIQAADTSRGRGHSDPEAVCPPWFEPAWPPGSLWESGCWSGVWQEVGTGQGAGLAHLSHRAEERDFIWHTLASICLPLFEESGPTFSSCTKPGKLGSWSFSQRLAAGDDLKRWNHSCAFGRFCRRFIRTFQFSSIHTHLLLPSCGYSPVSVPACGTVRLVTGKEQHLWTERLLQSTLTS